MDSPAAVRIVVDVTGGAIHAVYADQPVEIVFVSHDGDDIDDEQATANFRSIQGEQVALWMDGSDSDNGADSEVVTHYFDQYAKS
ncbi:hypothetical protein [Pseudomonas sp. W5-01]|uniref:hypothetical protein n=1 Tax=Pseudomonas sp. W5-01 TaxID=3097454 RepID=UPI00397AECFA